MPIRNGIEEISENHFHEKIDNPLTVIDFFAGWHMPCLLMEPVIEEMAEKFDIIKFARVNVDECSKITDKFSISKFPTLVLFKKGEEIERIQGQLPAEELEEKLKGFIK